MIRTMILTLLLTLSSISHAGVEEIGTLPLEMEREGTLMRGERDEYLFYAQPGTVLWITLSSAEDNAVFQLYGEVEGSWTALIGADEGDDATEWKNALPDGGSGQFKIVVGGTRGNASYQLSTAVQESD
jgi:hypothetical protein